MQGDINHTGSGLSLTAGPATAQPTDFDIDPGASVLYGDVSVNGAPAATHALLFNLDGSTPQPLRNGPDDTAILQGIRVLLSKDAAGLLNKTFNTDAVKEGLAGRRRDDHTEHQVGAAMPEEVVSGEAQGNSLSSRPDRTGCS
ncbi:hypothetical protein [Nocardia kruczakiae]|uniref:hypothetical protein n=1 Tax=Nocardia kruczakiae TaxID=261477 RepID=UPI0007A50E2E|nr:hypothetical protein [Nocardia kruczakiae]